MVVYVYSRWLCNLEINDILKNVEIVVSIFALVCAFMAYRQSLKARRYSSFETIFAQMLSEQRSFFENQHMLNAERRPLTDEFVSMFYRLIKCVQDNKYDYVRDIMQNHHGEIRSNLEQIEQIRKDTSLSGSDQCLNIVNINNKIDSIIEEKIKHFAAWRNIGGGLIEISKEDLSFYYKFFVDCTNNVEYFKNSFKFIYNIVTLVEKAQIEDTDKQLYIDRIQALLNRNEMFCYFVNLVEYHKEFLQGNEVDEKHYISRLKKYKFFKDLDDRDGRFHNILLTINTNLLDKFGIEIKK